MLFIKSQLLYKLSKPNMFIVLAVFWHGHCMYTTIYLLLFSLLSAVNRRPTMWLGEPSPRSSVPYHLQCLRHLDDFYSRSCLTLSIHCFLGLPLIRVPSMLQCNAIFGICVVFILVICPNHINLFVCILCTIVSLCPSFSLMTSFLILWFLRYPIFVSTSSSLPLVFFVHRLSWVSSILIRIMPPV